MIPRLPSDRDTFDKTILILILVGFCGLSTLFLFKNLESGSTWAMQQVGTILGALLLKINSDRKPNPPGAPQESPPTNPPPSTLTIPAAASAVVTIPPATGAP